MHSHRPSVHTALFRGTIAIILAGIVAVVSVLLATATSAQAPLRQELPGVDTPTATMTAQTCDDSWSVVPSPNVGAGDNFLTAVTSLSADDAWAVGYYTGTGRYLTLTEHWNGTQWSVVQSPNPGTYNNVLRGVTAIASNDVWAVGDFNYDPVHPTRHLLTIHWDGTQWNVVPNPDPGGNYDNSINAAKGFNSQNVWAVGFYRYTGFDDLRMLWTNTWTVNYTPTVPYGHSYGVDGLGPTDVWSVGIDTNNRPLTEHFDGQVWEVVPNPTLPDIEDTLFGVSVVATNDVWAVGVSNAYPSPHTLTEHWDGSAWNVVPAPEVYALAGVKAVSASDVWAVGIGVFLHWDGAAWSIVNDAVSGNLRGIGGNDPTNVWAVGTQSAGAVTHTLVERLALGCTPASPTPTVSSTSTGTATATAIATATSTTPASTATSTATSTSTSIPVTPTGTACAVAFADVHEGSTFYPYIHCLACLGVVQGYADGTYRPGNNVTRGQAAKIIANSAGWADDIPAQQQTFNDVPPGSTFWLYVERAKLHNAIGGYTCGGAGEPCPGAYFRPGNILTRGQIAKISSVAAGWTDPIPPQQQTFNDVPPGSTFWLYIERMALHGVVGGYADGTYRPQNAVTRGQIAKIAANTFFPDCAITGAALYR